MRHDTNLLWPAYFFLNDHKLILKAGGFTHSYWPLYPCGIYCELALTRQNYKVTEQKSRCAVGEKYGISKFEIFDIEILENFMKLDGFCELIWDSRRGRRPSKSRCLHEVLKYIFSIFSTVPLKTPNWTPQCILSDV